jgi:hypothetical protein
VLSAIYSGVKAFQVVFSAVLMVLIAVSSVLSAVRAFQDRKGASEERKIVCRGLLKTGKKALRRFLSALKTRKERVKGSQEGKESVKQLSTPFVTP